MAELELAGGLELSAALKATTDALSRRNDLEDRLMRSIPIAAQIQGSGVFPSSGSLIFDLGGPTAGKAWVLRRLFISGVDPTATAAGSAYYFISSSLSDNALVAASCFDFANALPLKAFYSSRQVVLTYPQRIVCKVVSGTSAATYQASGFAMEEVANDPVASRWTL